MRLTASIKQQIVDSVMADTKTADYLGQANALITKHVVAAAPKVIRDAFAFDPNVFNHYSTYHEAGAHVKYPALFDGADKIASGAKDVSSLLKAYLAQTKAQKEAKKALEALLRGCTTTDQVAGVAPELAKYLPKDAPKKALPVATGLKDTLKAAGWPK